MVAFLKPRFISKLSFVFVLLLSLSIFATDTIGPMNPQSNSNLVLGMPQNLKNTSEVMISRDEYFMSWNPQTRIINWVAWKLEANDMGSTPRPKSFDMDLELNSYLHARYKQFAVGPRDLVGSCFDKGHQVPAGDRNANLASDQMTFLMSNVVPQTAFLNRGIWEHLERHERALVGDGKTLLIFVGVIFDRPVGVIGPQHNIAVPTHNFKIIFDITGWQAGSRKLDPVVVVIMPNTTSKGTDPVADNATLCAEFNDNAQKTTLNMNDWQMYRSNLHEVMQRSGFDFTNLIAWKSSRQ